MKNKILDILGVLVAIAIICLIIVLVVKYWAIVSGLFWTLVIASAAAYGTFRLVEWIRLDSRRPRFHPIWTLAATLTVFLCIWGFGYNMVMLGVEMKPLEAEFLYHANNDPCKIENGQLNYSGSLDQILAKRDALLHKRHARMVGDWWTSTDFPPRVNAYYEWDPLWWWPHKE